MADPSPSDFFDRARDADSLAAIVMQGVGGTMLAIFYMIQDGIISVGQLVTRPLDALSSGAAELLSQIVTSPVPILDASVYATAQSLLPGSMFYLGPATFALGVAAVLGGVAVLAYYISLDETSNFGIGVGVDIDYGAIPFLEDPEEEDD